MGCGDTQGFNSSSLAVGMRALLNQSQGCHTFLATCERHQGVWLAVHTKEIAFRFGFCRVAVLQAAELRLTRRARSW